MNINIQIDKKLYLKYDFYNTLPFYIVFIYPVGFKNLMKTIENLTICVRLSAVGIVKSLCTSVLTISVSLYSFKCFVC